MSGRFEAGGSKVEVGGGRLRILAAGGIPKLVNEVSHISFSGEMGQAHRQTVTLITERCVLRFKDGGWHLKEIAPGADVKIDVLNQTCVGGSSFS